MQERKVFYISVENIIPNPYQPRKVFTPSSLMELSESIKEHGVLQPITVRKLTEKTFELIAGERRLKAAKLAGLIEVPTIIANVSDEQSAVLALIENIQREDLNFIEEAKAYEKLINDYQITQQELSKKVGKNQSTIANKLRILRLPDFIKDKVVENNLTERHARALLKIPDEHIQEETLNTIIENELNVKKTDELIKSIINDLSSFGKIQNKEENSSEEEKDNLVEKKQKIKGFINFKIYTNTIKNAFKAIVDSGLEANYDEKDKGEYIEITVQIPKNK